MTDDIKFYENAQRRRRTWRGGIAHGFEQAATANRLFWQEASPEERFLALWQMASDFWHLQGNHRPLPRFQRTIGGIRRKEG